MILSKIKEFYASNRKTIFYTLVFWFLFYISQDVAFAEGNPNAPATKTDWADKNAIVEVVDFIIAIASSLVALLSSLVSLFLHPGWVNGTILWFDIYLKEMWIMISNIVYFIFAFLLIAIAFMNIIWKGGDVWAMKQALPKFVIWVLMVPFSWFFVQFILSLSAFLTVAVLWIPHDTMSWTKPYENLKGKKICTTFVLDLTKWAENNIGKQAQNGGKDGSKCAFGREKEEIQKILEWKGDGISSSIYGMINIYTYGVMKIDRLDKLKGKDIVSDLKNLTSIALKWIFDLLFIVVYLILMVALFMALFARATWLWIHAMFSPVFGLMFFFWKTKEWALDGKFWPMELINLALVPVYVSAALAFWMMFMFVAANWLTEKTNGWSAIFQQVNTKGWDTIAINWKEWIKDGYIPSLTIGSFTLWIKGKQWWYTDTNDIFSELWSGLWRLILELFWLAILWLAMMVALKWSKITDSVTEPIRAFGKSVWSLIAKSPQYAPIIPTWKWMMNAASLKNFWETTVWSINSRMAKPWSELSNKFFWDWSKMQQALRDFKLSEVHAWTTDSSRLKSKLIPVLDRLNDKDLLKPDYIAAVDQLISTKFINKDDRSKLVDLYDHRWEKGFAKKLYDLIKANKSWYDPLNIAEIRSTDKMGEVIWGTSSKADWDKKESPTTTGAVSESQKVRNSLNINNLKIVENASWTKTILGIDSKKSADVAKKLLGDTTLGIKNLEVDDFIAEFKEHWIDVDDIKQIWEEIEILKKKS